MLFLSIVITNFNWLVKQHKTMKKITFFFSLAILFFFLSSNWLQAQNSLLWKIEGEGLEQPSYLYGTMHSQDKRVHELGKLALPYLSQSEAVALELVIDSAQMMPMMMSMFSDMMMKDTTLEDLYKEEDYQLVKNHVAKELGLVALIFKIEKMKPLFIALFMEEMSSINGGNIGREMDMALDQYFQKVGEKQGKKLIGVETFQEQMSAFNRIPLQEQANMLLEGAKMEKKGGAPDSSMLRLMDFYLQQDLEGLMQWYEKEQAYKKSSFDTFILLERNYRMADRMFEMIQKQSTFIAVGALHLPGEDGLIQLLTDKGYKLSPILMGQKLEETPLEEEVGKLLFEKKE